MTEHESTSSPNPRPARGGFATYANASFGHALLMALRQRRLVLATSVSLLPVLMPLALVFLSTAEFAENGKDTFTFIAENIYVNALAPLLALFFATMLIGQDVEGQTVPYVLTRPIPRSAWVLGRFSAYVLVASSILAVSAALMFAASTALEGLTFSGSDLGLLLHFVAVVVFALVGYGSLTMCLGAVTKRPIIFGVLLIYGWQPVAHTIPGLIDFFTIRKYTDAVLPSLIAKGPTTSIASVIGEITKQIYAISAGQAIVMLGTISVGFVVFTVLAVRHREYSSSQAAGD